MNKKVLIPSVITLVVAIAVVFFIFSSTNNLSQISDNSITPSVIPTLTKDIVVSHTMSISNASSPALAINPNTGSMHLAYTQSQNNMTNLYMITSSDLKVFSTPVKVNDVDIDPDQGTVIPIRFGPDGEMYVVWNHPGEHPDFWGGIMNLRSAKSMDYGRTFEPSIDPASALPKSEKIYPELEVTKEGVLLMPYVNNDLVFLDGGAVTYNTQTIDYVTQTPLLRSDDGGKTFQQIMMDAQSCQCCPISTTIGPDGEVYMVWRTSDKQYTSPVSSSDKYSNYYSSQEEWIEGLSESERKAYDEGLIAPPTEYTTARDMLFSRTTDGGIGLEWTEPIRIQDAKWNYKGCPSLGAGMAFDDNGRLYIAYYTGAGEDGKIGFYYVHSDDLGKTFSKPIALFSADFVALNHHKIQVAVDKNDNVWFSFIMLNDPTITEKSWSLLNPERVVHVFAYDKMGNLIGKQEFNIGSSHALPTMVYFNDKMLLGYTDHNGAHLVSLGIV